MPIRRNTIHATPRTWSVRSLSASSSGSPPRPRSTASSTASTASTKGMIESSNQTRCTPRAAPAEVVVPFESPQAIGRHGDRSRQRPSGAEEPCGVLAEGGAMDSTAFTEDLVLRAALARDDEQGAERRDEQEPGGQRHVGGGTAGDCPQHEAGAHARHLDDRHPFQSERVGEADDHVGADDAGEHSIRKGGRRPPTKLQAERRPRSRRPEPGARRLRSGGCA